MWSQKKDCGPRHSQGPVGQGDSAVMSSPATRVCKGRLESHDREPSSTAETVAAIRPLPYAAPLAFCVSISHGTFCGSFLLGRNYTAGRSLPPPMFSAWKPDAK